MAEGHNIKNILLIEDSTSDARLLEEHLMKEFRDQYRIIHHARLKKGLDHLKSHRADIVLLDLSLPDSKGLHGVEEIHAIFPDMPIIVLSGLEEDEIVLQAVQKGAQDYLIKGEASGALINRAICYAIERKAAEQRLTQLAHYDPLTGLANRMLFEIRLKETLSQARRFKHLVALMFLDIDHFKHINDSMGHHIGDEILAQFAKRLKGILREYDTVSRIGGDEFTIILDRIPRIDDASVVARKILDAFETPIFVESNEIQISTSIGIAHYPEHGIDPETLIKCADAAMYKAKGKGRNSFSYWKL